MGRAIIHVKNKQHVMNDTCVNRVVGTVEE